MTLWFVLALMTAAAMFAVLWPLARRDRGARAGSDLAVYRDQLEEIDRDRAAGRIGDGEAEAAQVEVSRRLHCGRRCGGGQGGEHAPRVAADAPAASGRHRGSGRAAARRAACIYLALGSPALPDQPLAAARSPDQSIESLVAQVEAHLERQSGRWPRLGGDRAGLYAARPFRGCGQGAAQGACD